MFVGYWVLWSVNIREKKILYFDSQRKLSDISEFVGALIALLKEEFSLSGSAVVEDTPLRDMIVERYEETDVFDEADSGVYVLKHVEHVCSGKREVLNRELVGQYREQLLHRLFIHGEKPCANKSKS